MRRWGLINRVQGRVARFRQEIIPGTEIGETIDIGRLMCPLRYDLWVRIEFVRLLREQWALYNDDLPGFLDRPQSEAYYVWFKEVRCALYRPEIYREEERVKAEFIQRVHETATLWSSIERNGYDRSTPIRLGGGRSIRSVNGKVINSTYFAGDGCHRMSCLYVTGQTQLEPEDYEVHVRQEFEPLDITAVLIQQLRLDRTTYLHFLSRFYCDGSQFDSADQILQHVASEKPDLLAELESVLAFDLPRSETMTNKPAGPETLDIDRFIGETEFAGYQRITLPDGRVIPGTDRSPAAELVFPADLTGKSVLDVGCNYGFFLQEAIRRGAKRAVGIEANPESFRIASTLATLWDGKIDIHQGMLEDVELKDKFDLVIFLNVIHHVTDPVPVVRKLASLCCGTLILEFRQPHDAQFVQECFHKEKLPAAGRRSLVRRVGQRIRMAAETRLMELATRRLPIIGVGSVEYHRSYFFSQAGFMNMFQVHNQMFKSVEFRPSLTRGQALAVCDCSEGRQA